jgi:hypothetical protein
MAQRGGRVTSEIRFYDDPAFSFGARISPGGADVLIGMETGETINSLPYLRKGGFVIALDQATVPVELSLKKASYPGLGEAERAFEAHTGRSYAVGGRFHRTTSFSWVCSPRSHPPWNRTSPCFQRGSELHRPASGALSRGSRQGGRSCPFIVEARRGRGSAGAARAPGRPGPARGQALPSRRKQPPAGTGRDLGFGALALVCR